MITVYQLSYMGFDPLPDTEFSVWGVNTPTDLDEKENVYHTVYLHHNIQQYYVAIACSPTIVQLFVNFLDIYYVNIKQYFLSTSKGSLSTTAKRTTTHFKSLYWSKVYWVKRRKAFG